MKKAGSFPVNIELVFGETLNEKMNVKVKHIDFPIFITSIKKIAVMEDYVNVLARCRKHDPEIHGDEIEYLEGRFKG